MTKDWGTWIFIDTDYKSGILHACDMLGRSGNAAGNIYIRPDNCPRDANLVPIIDPAHVHQGSGCPDSRGRKTFCKFKNQVKILFCANAPTRSYNDFCLFQGLVFTRPF